MKVATLLGLMLVLSIGTGTSAVGDDVMEQLVPTGKLRVGVAYAPASTPIFVAKDAAGNVHGVPLDLGNALARTLGVPIEIVVVATTGELTDACSSGTIDIGFMPADDKRRTRVDFSPPYFVIESTLSRRWPFRHQDACGGRPSRGHGRRHRRIDHLARRRPQLEEREGRASEIYRRSHGEMMK